MVSDGEGMVIMKRCQNKYELVSAAKDFIAAVKGGKVVLGEKGWDDQGLMLYLG